MFSALVGHHPWLRQGIFSFVEGYHQFCEGWLVLDCGGISSVLQGISSVLV